MSTPIRAAQRRPISAGNGSPAETQRRNATSDAAGRLGSRASHCKERRHAVKDRRPLFAQDAAADRRARTFGGEHAGGADRHRKGQRVAEPIGEKQLCRRKDDVAFCDAEDRDGIVFRRLDQALVEMDRALWTAGRARRIKPKARLVGVGRHALRVGRRFGEQGSERGRCIWLAGDDDRRLGAGIIATAAVITGKIGADTMTARARLSASIKANSSALSWVLTATGTMPALIAPRKAVGKSMPSCRQRRIRCSRRRPSARNALAKRAARSAKSA